MDVNDNANILDKRVTRKTFASKLAPTRDCGEFRMKKAPTIARRGFGYFNRTQCPPR